MRHLIDTQASGAQTQRRCEARHKALTAACVRCVVCPDVYDKETHDRMSRAAFEW